MKSRFFTNVLFATALAVTTIGFSGARVWADDHSLEAHDGTRVEWQAHLDAAAWERTDQALNCCSVAKADELEKIL